MINSERGGGVHHDSSPTQHSPPVEPRGRLLAAGQLAAGFRAMALHAVATPCNRLCIINGEYMMLFQGDHEVAPPVIRTSRKAAHHAAE
jgi:hypothetical protein